MSASGIFSDSDLRGIKRTFYTRKATPEEVCLVVKPRRRSQHTVLTAIPMVATLPFWLWMGLGDYVYGVSTPFQSIQVFEFWCACAFIFLLMVLVFVLLPGAYVPRFEVTVRPGGDSIAMRGFGFEQRRPASYCMVLNRHLWCTFSVDRIGYLLLRRWWQLPLPIRPGAAAIERALAPSKAALKAALEGGGGQAEMMASARRFVLARSFGEAFMTENEVVLMLPPRTWHVLVGALGAALGSCGVLFWHPFHRPSHAYYTADHKVVEYMCAIPMWLPSAIAVLLVGLWCIWADPWFRRAVAVIPKGAQRIRIQVGKRVRGESWFWDDSIGATDAKYSSEGMNYLEVNTPFWSGTRTAWRSVECWRAEQELKAWAGFPPEKDGDGHG